MFSSPVVALLRFRVLRQVALYIHRIVQAGITKQQLRNSWVFSPKSSILPRNYLDPRPVFKDINRFVEQPATTAWFVPFWRTIPERGVTDSRTTTPRISVNRALGRNRISAH